MKSYLTFFLLTSVLLHFSCIDVQNDNESYIIEKDGKIYIKLTGKRDLMAHDPISVLKDKKYKDSILIEIPAIKDGTINANDIPVKKGNFHFSGNLTIRGNQLKIDLLVDDTDSNKQRPLMWNGDYRLIKPGH